MEIVVVEWVNLDRGLVNEVVSSMPARLAAVIAIFRLWGIESKPNAIKGVVFDFNGTDGTLDRALNFGDPLQLVVRDQGISWTISSFACSSSLPYEHHLFDSSTSKVHSSCSDHVAEHISNHASCIYIVDIRPLNKDRTPLPPRILTLSRNRLELHYV